MEVTKRNFAEKLDDIANAIQQATFLSVDTEFTGLDTPEYGHTCPFDTPADRYSKMCKGCLDYLIIQFGLCSFKFNEETQSYEARPFNFYIFPHPYTRQAPDRRFLCQTSSIDFLVQQGFDFNKLFKEGISYLMPKQEESMREVLNSKHEMFSKFVSRPATSSLSISPSSIGSESEMMLGKGPVQVPEEQKEFINSICEQVSNFVETSGTDDILKLEPCNGFQRKLIYQTIGSQFTSVHLETKTGAKKERFIVVSRAASEEELRNREKDKQNAEIMQLDDAVGFARVMKLITQSRKMVVGHNMLLDVVHILNQFYGPLPQDLDEFKAMVKEYLPRLVDTKLMASTHPFREFIPNTSLEELQKTLDKEPFNPAKVVLAEDFKRYENAKEMYHEAGYDAFITGCLFATMANHLGSFQDPVQPVVLPAAKLVEPFVNKLFLMRIADIPYLNLNGPDLDPNRDHVFHLTFPREWRSADINQLFAPFGSIHISWLNDTSAFIALHKKDSDLLVRKALCSDRSTYQLVPYSVYRSGTIPLSLSPISPRKRFSTEEDIPAHDSLYSWTNKRRKATLEETARPVDVLSTPPVDEEIEAEMQAAMDLSTDRSKTISSVSSTELAAEDASKGKMFTEPSNW